MRRFIKFLIGIALLPVCVALTYVLFRTCQVLVQSPTRLPAVSAGACLLGILVWVLVWIFLPPFTKTYILGHELTHALWALFFGAKASGLRVGESGGSVRVSKSNVWITLAPYFFPLYTVLTALAWGLAAWLFPQWQHAAPVFLFLIGLTWAFHITFTLKFLSIHQPDVKEHGRLFSYALIYALNVLVVVAALTTAGSWHAADALDWFLDSLHAQQAAAAGFIEWLRATCLSA